MSGEAALAFLARLPSGMKNAGMQVSAYQVPYKDKDKTIVFADIESDLDLTASQGKTKSHRIPEQIGF